MTTDEILEVIMYQLGMVLVIQILKFALDYCVHPLKRFISSMFPER